MCILFTRHMQSSLEEDRRTCMRLIYQRVWRMLSRCSGLNLKTQFLSESAWALRRARRLFLCHYLEDECSCKVRLNSTSYHSKVNQREVRTSLFALSNISLSIPGTADIPAPPAPRNVARSWRSRAQTYQYGED